MSDPVVGADPEVEAAGSAAGAADLVTQIEDERSRLDRELGEIELLVQQARTEAARHEARRAAAAERLTEMRRRGPPSDRDELHDQLLATGGRAQMMQAQIEILEGKQRALTRYRDRLAAIAERLDALPVPSDGLAAGAAPGTHDGSAGLTVGQLRQGRSTATDAPGLTPELSRTILSAQEDLRREIARSMHDGPAQSLTNIALQAQIVQRLVARDPAGAEQEVGRLVEMVQRALDATKNFIFDVRPMVLDDLGLVPTLRRAAHDRGRRARVEIQFESAGADRRLDPDLESSLFRILDDALVGYLATQPPALGVRLDWSEDAVQARVESRWDEEATAPDGTAEAAEGEAGGLSPAGGEEPGKGRLARRFGRGREPEPEPEVPQALAQMIAEQQDEQAAASLAADNARAVARALPPETWREIQARARTLGVTVQLVDEGLSLLAGVRLEAAPA